MYIHIRADQDTCSTEKSGLIPNSRFLGSDSAQRHRRQTLTNDYHKHELIMIIFTRAEVMRPPYLVRGTTRRPRHLQFGRRTKA
jgi:hypothetical protein